MPLNGPISDPLPTIAARLYVVPHHMSRLLALPARRPVDERRGRLPDLVAAQCLSAGLRPPGWPHSSSMCAMIEVVHAGCSTVNHTTNYVAAALFAVGSNG